MASKGLKIALVGATGGSGLQVMHQALARGHSIRALVRSPEKVTIQHENLQVVKADLLDSSSLITGFADCNLVISCFGARGSVPKDASPYLDIMKCITTAMRENNITRVIAITSWGTYKDSRTPYFIEYFLRFIIAQVLESMRGMELYLEQECKDLDFTVVRPAGLADRPSSGKPIEVAEDCPCVPQGWCSANFSISRADVARFMLDIVENNSYTKKAVAISC